MIVTVPGAFAPVPGAEDLELVGTDPDDAGPSPIHAGGAAGDGVVAGV